MTAMVTSLPVTPGFSQALAAPVSTSAPALTRSFGMILEMRWTSSRSASFLIWSASPCMATPRRALWVV